MRYLQEKINLILDCCVEDLDMLRDVYEKAKEKKIDDPVLDVSMQVMEKLNDRYKIIHTVLNDLLKTEKMSVLLCRQQKEHKTAYQEPFSVFIDERTNIGAEFKVKPIDLYHAYVNWSLDVGIKYMGKHVFYKRITDRKIKAKRMRPQVAIGVQGSVEMFVGIGLK